MQHEVFGPVLTLQTFTGEADAIRARQQHASTASPRRSGRAREERAERVGRALRAGTVWVNCFLSAT